MPHLLSLHGYGGYSGYHGYYARNIHLRPNHIVFMVMRYASYPVFTGYGGYSGYCGCHGYISYLKERKFSPTLMIWLL